MLKPDRISSANDGDLGFTALLLMNQMVGERIGGLHSAPILMYSIASGEFSQDERMDEPENRRPLRTTTANALRRNPASSRYCRTRGARLHQRGIFLTARAARFEKDSRAGLGRIIDRLIREEGAKPGLARTTDKRVLN